MGWAQYIQGGMQMAGGLFDTAASGVDARTQKRMGYASADANEERVRRDTAQALGHQRAAAAESGFVSNTGSMLTLQGESAGNAELDALTERYKGQFNAWQMDEQIRRAEEKMSFVINPIGHQLGRRASTILTGGPGFFEYGAGRSFAKNTTKG